VQTYDESVVVSNQSFGSGGGCVNCHTFAPNHPDQMILHSRGTGELSAQSGMVVIRQGRVTKVDTRTLIQNAESDRGRVKKSLAGYIAWHPNGRLAAYAAGDMFQFFHTVGENRDVFNRESDLALYHADSNTVTTAPQISAPDRVETFPAWSPDGRYLYFCGTDPLPAERYRDVRYDLMRISYDPDSQRWGEVEPVLLAKDTGLSIAEPRISPDGRWLLFCMANYGEFPVFQPSSDLYLMDLKTRRYERLAVNSPRSDSWHCWSSNSRWIAFASKRRDGVFARVYFSYVDEHGRVHKPVLLPQKDPTFYDRFLKTYNAPELARAPAPVPERAIVQAICNPSTNAPESNN
jgi:dipeptidyl aminopeptidase/acylaminoacyl peptidase